MVGGGADPGGWGGVTLGAARPPCLVRPDPPPLSPRSLGRGAAPGPDVCSARAASPPAPLPAAGRVRALRLLRAPD